MWLSKNFISTLTVLFIGFSITGCGGSGSSGGGSSGAIMALKQTTSSGSSIAGFSVSSFVSAETPVTGTTSTGTLSNTFGITPPANTTFTGIAFDKNGNLWVTEAPTSYVNCSPGSPNPSSTTSTIVEYSASSLSNGAPSTTGQTVTVTGVVDGIAFDSTGDLWITVSSGNNNSSCTGGFVSMYPVLSNGNISGTASFTITSPFNNSTGYQPIFVLFDSSGNLWISNANVGSGTGPILEYSKSVIPPHSTTGSASTPSLTFSTTVGTDTQLFQGAAFDKQGNLWAGVICSYTHNTQCTHYFSHVVEFKASTISGLITTGGTVSQPPDYTFQVPGTAPAPTNSAYNTNDTYIAGGAGFDSGGNLWVTVGALSNSTGSIDLSASPYLFQYASTALGTTAPLPINEFTLSKGVIGFWAFWPIPTGLPLY